MVKIMLLHFISDKKSFSGIAPAALRESPLDNVLFEK